MEDTTKSARRPHDFRVKKNQVIKHPRRCDKPGCENGGEFRAPKDRQNLRDYYWFCLDHVREYNQAWDFFKDMKPDQIEAYQRAALTGLRPTWKLGMQGQPEAPNPKLKFFFKGAFVDPFILFEDGPAAPGPSVKERPQNGKAGGKLTKMQLASLDTLNLEPTATLQEVKQRFKELVKRFHPDANGGDRGAEENLRQVIKAYGQLRSSGFC
ncbi:MAG: DnaJ domain-containing protein [Alphaproteobacteria bacterium]|nr:DnaJ domain-containing protein [Alphaproteobacteria bacterium]